MVNIDQGLCPRSESSGWSIRDDYRRHSPTNSRFPTNSNLLQKQGCLQSEAVRVQRRIQEHPLRKQSDQKQKRVVHSSEKRDRDSKWLCYACIDIVAMLTTIGRSCYMEFKYNSVYHVILTLFYFISSCVTDTHAHITLASLARTAHLRQKDRTNERKKKERKKK